MGALLTVGNPKTVKGQRYGFRTAVLHLSPERASGVANVCPMATKGCAFACLNTAGRGGIGLTTIGDNAIQRARRARTARLFADRAGFLLELRAEIAAFVKACDRKGFTPCIRLNGTSDLRWETRAFELEGATMFDTFPALQFYDYTKIPNRRGLPANYHLTFSLAESARNRRDALAAFASGLSVAVVLSGAGDSVHKRPLPATWNGRPMVDGDDSDLRFLDPAGVWVALRAKGRARGDASGFVYDVSRTYDYLAEGGSDARTSPASRTRSRNVGSTATGDNGRRDSNGNARVRGSNRTSRGVRELAG